MRKTKIICTLGPASESEEVLRKLMLEGMNVARFNFSHGTHEEQLEKLNRVKRLRDELNLPIAALLDTETIRAYKAICDELGLSALVEAHDEQEQAGVPLEYVAGKKAHEPASLFFLRAFQLAQYSVMRGILSWSASRMP